MVEFNLISDDSCDTSISELSNSYSTREYSTGRIPVRGRSVVTEGIPVDSGDSLVGDTGAGLSGMVVGTADDGSALLDRIHVSLPLGSLENLSFELTFFDQTLSFFEPTTHLTLGSFSLSSSGTISIVHRSRDD